MQRVDALVGIDAVSFGDNETVVNTASMPHSKLNKRHNGLLYHKTRLPIAASILRFANVPGATNPSDILSKHWDYCKRMESVVHSY